MFKKDSLLKSIIIWLIVAMSVTTIIYAVREALISSNVPIDSEISTGTIEHEVNGELESTEISLEYTSAELAFSTPGDSAEVAANIVNNTANHLHYYFGLSLEAEDSSGLSSAIFVYYNDQFLDTLAGFIAGGGRVDIGEFIGPATLSEGNVIPGTAKGTFRFELHIAAQGSRFASKAVSIKVVSYVQNIDHQKYMLVSDGGQLSAAINDINYSGDYKPEDFIPTVVLLSDISLDKTYEIHNLFSLNLNGHYINFNGKNIILQQSGKVKVYSTRTIELPQNYHLISGGFELSGEYALLDIQDFEGKTQDNPAQYKTAYQIYGESVVLTSFDTYAAAELLSEGLLGRVGSVVTAGSDIDVFGANYFYEKKSAAMEIITNIGYTYSDGIITTNPSEVTIVTSISIGANTYEFKIIGFGADGDILTGLLSGELKHIPRKAGNEVKDISYDLFLPTAISAKNVSIEWFTSDAQLLTAQGKIGSELSGDTTVTLTAKIRINNNVYTQDFTFLVFNQNNALKLSYFLALINPISFYEVGTDHKLILPIVDANADNDYRKSFNIREGTADRPKLEWSAYEDIGLVSLEYSIAPEYGYLVIMDNHEVFLSQPVFFKYAEINVTAEFLGEEGITYPYVINVRIELGGNAELHNIVYNYINSEINKIDILQQILDTRLTYGIMGEKGDFLLPAKYMFFDIIYSFDDSGILTHDNTSNDDINLLNIKVDASKFYIEDTSIPITIVLKQGSVTSNERTFYVAAPGALHNNSDGFLNTSVFNSIKYQVYQQQAEKGDTLLSGYAQDGDLLTITDAKDYILRHDIENITTLVLDNTSSIEEDGQSNKLFDLLTWAVSPHSFGITAGEVVGNSQTQVSNGVTSISDEEKDAIRQYAISLGGLTVAEFNAIWDDVTLQADYYIVTDPVRLDQAVRDEINRGSGYKGLRQVVYFKYTEMLLWATNVKDYGLRAGAAEEGGPPNTGWHGNQSIEDYKDTISEAENGAMIAFMLRTRSDNNNTALRNVWTTYVSKPVYFKDTGMTELHQQILGKSLNGEFTLKSHADSAIKYTPVTNLDASLNGLSYFSSLKNLYIYGNNGEGTTQRPVETPLFTKQDNAVTFFNNLSLSNEGIEKLILQNIALKGYANLPIDNIINFENLTHIDLSGNSGIRYIGTLGSLKQIELLNYLNVSGIDNSIQFIDTVLFDINSKATGAQIYHTDDILYDYESKQDNDALALLAQLKEIDSLDGRYLQLADSLYDSNGTKHEIAWSVEQGNPIREIKYYDTAAFKNNISTRSNASQFVSLLTSHYVITASFYFDKVQYQVNQLYKFRANLWGVPEFVREKDSYGNDVSVTDSFNSMPEVVIRTTTGSVSVGTYFYWGGTDRASFGGATLRTGRIYYRSGTNSVSEYRNVFYWSGTTGTVYNGNYSLINGRIYRNNTSRIITENNGYFRWTGTTTTFKGATLTNGRIYRNHSGTIAELIYAGIGSEDSSGYTTMPIWDEILKVSRSTFYKYTGATTNITVYDGDTSSILSLEQNAYYRIAFNENLDRMDAYKMEDSDIEKETLMGLFNAEPNYIASNLYYYTGATISGYITNTVYKFNYSENRLDYYYRDNSMVKTGNTEQNLLILAFDGAQIGNLYYNNTTLGYHNTFEKNLVYRMDIDPATGGYYLRRIGAVSFANTEGGALRLYNERYYPDNGMYYSGAGGDEEAVITATVTVNGVTYTRKFRVDVKG